MRRSVCLPFGCVLVVAAFGAAFAVPFMTGLLGLASAKAPPPAPPSSPTAIQITTAESFEVLDLILTLLAFNAAFGFCCGFAIVFAFGDVRLDDACSLSGSEMRFAAFLVLSILGGAFGLCLFGNCIWRCCKAPVPKEMARDIHRVAMTIDRELSPTGAGLGWISSPTPPMHMLYWQQEQPGSRVQKGGPLSNSPRLGMAHSGYL